MFMKRPPFKLIVCLFSGVLLSGSLAAGAEESRIDWQKNIISVVGISSIRIDDNGTPINIYDATHISINEARHLAYSRAKRIALEKMTTALLDMRVTQDETIGSLLKTDSFMRQRLYAAFDKIKFEDFPAGFDSSACRAKLSMGDIMNALPFTFPEQEFPQRTDTPIETEYSGLIIDSRGFAAKPMMFPVIYNKNGLEIVSRYNIHAVQAVKYGMVSYASNEKEAKLNKRLGAHPLYVVAIGENRGCPTLSEKDVRRIFSSSKTIKALQECRIVFIIDKE
jgi:hypothetical protein